MLFDELKLKLKNSEPDIAIIKEFWNNSNTEAEFNKLHELSVQENFWQNPNQASILKELQRLKTLKENYYLYINQYNDFNELLDMFENDPQEIEKLREEIFKWAKHLVKFKVSVLLQDEQDNENCFLNINSGAGGTESQDWAEILLRMYIRFCEREGLSSTILDYQAGEVAGIKSATIYIKGKHCYGLLKGEQGIHRLVRISPFDSAKRRHTSFASVYITPEVPNVAITIDPKDLRIDTYRAGGAGGQHVNKTDSAVRITHLPTNIVVQCQNERSQLQNKEVAMKMLMAKLVQKERDEQKAKEAAIEKKKIEWGSQIRSYILHPYKLVKDHRTDLESQLPENVLDGDIVNFIEAYLVQIQA